MPLTKYKAAAVTSEPCWFDLEVGIQKTVAFINEAGEAGYKLIAFLKSGSPVIPTGCGRSTTNNRSPC